ncbi:MAG TPA: LysR family transcriptional regulator [Thermoleophilaceae bacterium]|nr:LysR family transcriptional regulator [Thermoleophilaceae bacterium]
MLDVRRLRVLREVERQGSFSGAADALSFTQSAVSQQVAALEREAGASLVERGPRGVRVTEAGRALVAHADAILARLDDAEQELAAIAGLRGGRLRLVSFPSAGAALVPDAIAVFNRRYPDVELSLAEAEPYDSLPVLKAGGFDLAVVFDYTPFGEDRDAEIERVHLLDDVMHAALPREHPLAGRPRVRLADLAGDSWINGVRTCGEFMTQVCVAAGFEPQVTLESNDYATMQGLVAAGVGVTLIPDLVLATGVNPGVAVVPFAGRPPVRRIWAAAPASGYRSPATAAMIEILGEVCESFPARLKGAVAAAS